jgi:arylsulfatase A
MAIAVSFFAVLLQIYAPSAGAETIDHPNILLIVADDLGCEALGCYGGLDFSTPHLDRLASEGMRFSLAYTSPVCTPSRMTFYTGTYVTRHKYYDVLPVHLGTKKAVDFRNRWTTFAQLLREAGYATSVTGKWQLAALEFHPEHCRDAGFDSWCVWQIWRRREDHAVLEPGKTFA